MNFSLKFGCDGNASEYLGEGWSEPESGFIWTVGTKATLSLPNPGPHTCRMRIDYNAFIPPHRSFQRVAVSLDGEPVSAMVVSSNGSADLWIRREIVERAPSIMQLRFDLPDATSPASCIPDHPDDRILAISLRTLQLDVVPDDSEVTALADMARNMESLGSNCEFGLVQRVCGAEPLGLLRFATSAMSNLLPALEARFNGIGSDLDFAIHGTEWMILEKRYGFVAHTRQTVHQTSREQIERMERRRLPRLAEKLVSDLDSGEKLFVYQGDTAQTAEDGWVLLSAIRRYNPRNTLLLVIVDPGRSGEVEWHSNGLMIGYMPELPELANAETLQIKPWTMIVRHAFALWRGGYQ